MEDTTLQSTQEITDIDENSLQPCKKCNLPIYEGHAYELGDDRWHINCFKCSKCNSSLGCNSNFLVLGNGNLICSNCSYNCKQCGKKIDDLAILTGDQAYCSSCFKCRSCKLKIEDLRYARTSKGLFCMSCHEKLIAKKKKYDSKRKQIAQLQQQKENEGRDVNVHLQTPPQAYDVLRHLQEHTNSSSSVLSNTTNARDSIDTVSDVFTEQNKSNSSLSTKDKVLPPPPSNPPSQPSLLARESFNSIKTDSSLPSTATSRFSTPTSEYANAIPNNNAIPNANEIDNDYSIEEVNDSDDELKKKNTNKQLRSYNHEQVSTPPTSSAHDSLSPVKNIANGIRLDIIDSSEPSTPRHNQLQPAATFTPQSKDRNKNGEFRTQSPTSISRANFKGKNLLILSPNNLQGEEFYNPNHSSTGSPTYDMMSEYDDSRPTLSAPVDESKARSGCPSPFAKANRQARVVETNDYSQENSGIFLDNEENREDGFDVIRTPKKLGLSSSTTNTTSPPPKLPLPVIPSSPIKNDKIETPTIHETAKFNIKGETTPKGLGLAGVDYNESNDEIVYFKQDNENQHEKSTAQVYPQSQTPKQKSPATPAVTNLETPTNVDKDTPETKLELSRKSSLIRTPKISLKHKRSISGGNGSISQKFGFFKSSIKDEPISNPEKPRHGSVGSNSNGGSAFVTPPLPRTSLSNHQFQTNNGFIREHNRSTSDTPLTSIMDNRYSNDVLKNDLDMRPLRSEVYQLDTQKQNLLTENRALKSENEKLSEQLKNLQNSISMESANHESLAKEVIALEKRKKDLLEVNQSLSEQNHKLEISINNSSAISKLPSNDTAYTNSIGGTTVGNLLASLPSQNSSSSLIAGAPYNENNYSEEHTETQKATRLKFWRRPKVTPNLVSSNNNSNNQYGLQNSTSPQHQIQNNYQTQNTTPVQGQINQPSQNWNNGSNTKLSQTYSSQAIRPPNSKTFVNSININNGNTNGNTNNNDSLAVEGHNKKGIGSFMTKSRSTNILDSFLAGNSAHNSPNGNYELNDPILLTEIDYAPLFTSSILKRAEYENEKVPLIITKCIAEVEKRGLDVEGIYRISGGNSAIVAIENAFADLPPDSSKDEKQMRKLEEAIDGDINAVTSALKRYLRKLPEPLLPYAYYDDFIKVGLSISATKQDKRINELKLKVINKLPLTNKHALFLICKHLDLINSYAPVNRMNFKNLSVVFAPTLVRDESGEKEMIHMGYRNDVTELMLTNYQKLFYDYSH